MSTEAENPAEVAPIAIHNGDRLTRDAREFGLLVAMAVQSEFEGDDREERLQAIRSAFLQAIDYIEKQYGFAIAAMWRDEGISTPLLRVRFAELLFIAKALFCR
jgi:hypothetical protein